MRLKIALAMAASIAVFLACNSPGSANDSSAQTSSIKRSPPSPPKERGPSFRLLPFHPKSSASLIKAEGELVDGKHWYDANGENYAFLFRDEIKHGEKSTSVLLQAFHIAKTDTGMKEIARVIEEEKQCAFDNMADYLEYSLEVTDLDTDSLAEITFAYNMDCMKDLSPFALKLLMLENGKRYLMHGTTRIDLDGVMFGGEKKIDPSFDEAPNIFRRHANIRWDDYVGVW